MRGGNQKNRERAHRIENVKYVKTFMNTNVSLRTVTSCKGYLGLTFQQVQIMQQWVYLYIKKSATGASKVLYVCNRYRDFCR